MHEVYEVCNRLAAAGFPQDGRYRRVYETVPDSAWGDMADMARASDNPLACPNASECMKFARERGFQMHIADMGEFYMADISAAGTYLDSKIEGHNDPDQAARLALAAALEARDVAK